jgi:hypothetical protein
MEKIKKAIEKARKHRDSDAIQPKKQINHEAFKNEVSEGLEQLQYKQTRVCDLDPEHLEANRIVSFNKNDPSIWSFDVLRTQVIRKMDEQSFRTLAITSPTPEAGKTIVAINLALSIARQMNKSVMLVDFDLRRPKIGEYLGIPMGFSLNEYIEGKIEIKDALINPGIDRFIVLPTKTGIHNSSEFLASNKVQYLINEFRNRYESRIIIFDLPPLLSSDDALAVLPRIDSTLFVVGNGMSTEKQLMDSMRLLHSTNLLGTVLNMAEVTNKGYY